MSSFEFIFNTVWFFLAGFFVYYLLVLKPSAQKHDQHKKFIDGLRKGDEVVTSGGIFGRMAGVRPDGITVEIAQNVRIRVKPEHVLDPAAPTHPTARKGSEEKRGPGSETKLAAAANGDSK